MVVPENRHQHLLTFLECRAECLSYELKVYKKYTRFRNHRHVLHLFCLVVNIGLLVWATKSLWLTEYYSEFGLE